MTMYLVEFSRTWPRDTPDPAPDLGALDTTAAPLAAVNFAAYCHVTEGGDPVMLAFQGWVDVSTPQSAIGSAAIATAFSTAQTQLGMAVAPVWTDWRASTATPAPA